MTAGGCGIKRAPFLHAQGPVSHIELDLLLRTSAIMLVVIVPVILMAFWFAWRYRASNGKGRYTPNWTYSGRLDAVVWTIPALIVIALAVHLWIYSHRLDPYKRLDPAAQTLEVHVVAQDWKWLFLYPKQGIATVNDLAFPSGAPLSLKITSDTVMNSFSIPALGGQIYAMAGMRTELNLMADKPGHYSGRNTQYSGRGFANQHFTATAMTPQDFEAWLAKVRQSPDALDKAAYARLAQPGVPKEVIHYASYQAGLFEAIIAKYRGGSARAAAAGR